MTEKPCENPYCNTTHDEEDMISVDDNKLIHLFWVCSYACLSQVAQATHDRHQETLVPTFFS